MEAPKAELLPPAADPCALAAFMQTAAPGSPNAAAAGAPPAAGSTAQHPRAAAHGPDSEEADEDYVPPSRDTHHHGSHHHDRHHERHHERHHDRHHAREHDGGAASHRQHSSIHHSRSAGGGGGRGRRSILGVMAGRVSKAEAAAAYQQLQRSHQVHQEATAAAAEPEARLAPPRQYVTVHRPQGPSVARSHSAAASLQHAGAHHRKGGYHRSFSSPAGPAASGASLGGLMAASRMFAPILGALGGALGGPGAAPAPLGKRNPLGAAGNAVNGAYPGNGTTRPR